MKAKDITGLKFNNLTAIYRIDKNKHGKYIWLFLCDCENHIEIVASSVISGNTTSCGCKNISNITSHGDSRSRLYSIWRNMKYRCLNPKNSNYPTYGGRGIKVCERWLDYSNFKADTQESYSPELTLDRIDVNGNYEPSNFRWATLETQNNNTRRSIIIDTPWGKMSVSQCARKIGICKDTLSYRIKKNFTPDRLFVKNLKTPTKL